MIEQDEFIYSSLGKVFEKQTKKQFKALKDLNISDKVNELKEIENIFPKDVISDLIITELKKFLNYKTILNRYAKLQKV